MRVPLATKVPVYVEGSPKDGEAARFWIRDVPDKDCMEYAVVQLY